MPAVAAAFFAAHVAADLRVTAASSSVTIAAMGAKKAKPPDCGGIGSSSGLGIRGAANPVKPIASSSMLKKLPPDCPCVYSEGCLGILDSPFRRSLLYVCLLRDVPNIRKNGLESHRSHQSSAFEIIQLFFDIPANLIGDLFVLSSVGVFRRVDLDVRPD